MPNNEYHGNNDLLQINSITTAGAITSQAGGVTAPSFLFTFGYLRVGYRAVIATPDNVASGDCILGIQVNPCAVNLPSVVGLGSGYLLTIKDETGLASGISPITITPNGAETIDGVAAAITIIVPYGSVNLYVNNLGGWSIK